MTSPRRLSLRARMLTLLIGVTGVFLLIMGLVTTAVLTSRLSGQFNADLVAASTRGPRCKGMSRRDSVSSPPCITHAPRIVAERCRSNCICDESDVRDNPYVTVSGTPVICAEGTCPLAPAVTFVRRVVFSLP